MKKKISLFLVLLLGVFLLTGCDNKKYYEGYNHLNFKEILEAEEIELLNPDYEETDEQAIIYMFRGQGCGFCRSFLNFLNSISTEYGKYFKVISFEVWYDGNNGSLMSKMPTVTGVEARGVPYIIIGDKVFDGYSEKYNEEIKAKIKEQYDNPEYDVFEELKRAENGLISISNVGIVLFNLAITAIGVIIIVTNSNKNKEEILNVINKMEKENKKNSKNE